MHSNHIQKARAWRCRRKRRRPYFQPHEAYEFKNPDTPYAVKLYWRRRHRRRCPISWGGHSKSSGYFD